MTVPVGPARVELVERTLAWVRLGVVVGVFVLLVLGDDDVRSYPTAGFVVWTAAVIYTLVMMSRPHRLRPEISTTLDVGFATVIIAVTGAGRSPAIGIEFLALAAAALRFPPRVSRAAAIGGSAGIAIGIMAMPQPDLATADRVELAIAWSVALLLASSLVGLMSDLELQDREALLVERERARSLTEADAARRRILNMVAHDLTPPLVAVEGIARTLQDRSVELEPADRDEALAILLEHANHLRGFTTSLREVANAGDLTKLQRPRPVPVDLGTFLDGVCRAHTFGPGREVHLDATGPLPTITTDPDKLRRVIANLVDNAVRHSPADSPVVVSAWTDASTVAIRVTDSGSGIAEPDLESMFDPRWQGTGAVGEGGLGLWIVAELVGELGGSVAASNVARGGLTVDVRLPTR